MKVKHSISFSIISTIFITALSLAANAQVPSEPLSHDARVEADKSVEKFLGFWKTAEGDAIVEMRRCKRTNASRHKASVCAYILWDHYIGKVGERRHSLRCNKRLAQLDKYDGGTWSDGWAYDLRDGTAFNTQMYMNESGQLIARGYIGQKTQGRNYLFNRSAPPPIDCRNLPKNHPDLIWSK